MSQIDPANVSKIDISKIYESQKKNMLEGTQETNSSGFKEILSGFMSDVNELQNKADDKIEKLATGEIKDIHEVMLAATEADTSFKIMMEIRSKLMSAYKEISKMGGGQ
mgnify:CR=1 FL=1